MGFFMGVDQEIIEAARKLRAGEYAFEGEMSLDQIIDKMVRGEVVHHMVTFPEGTNLDEMARIAFLQGIPPAAFLEAARDTALVKELDPQARDLEGYVFPDTYEVAYAAGKHVFYRALDPATQDRLAELAIERTRPVWARAGDTVTPALADHVLAVLASTPDPDRRSTAVARNLHVLRQRGRFLLTASLTRGAN